MAEDSKPAVGADDILPMQKTSSTALIAGGVGAAVVVGLLIFALSGGESAPAKVESSEKAAIAQQGLTKAELEERQAHLKKTQQALMEAAVDEAEAGKKAAAAAPAPTDATERDATVRSVDAEPKRSGPAPTASKPPAQKKPGNSKKSMDGLDALGADIASALK